MYSSAIFTGFWAGLLFLAKPIGLPIFVATLLAFSFFKILTEQGSTRSVIAYATATLAVCCFIIAPWLIALRIKYGAFMIGLNPYFQV